MNRDFRNLLDELDAADLTPGAVIRSIRRNFDLTLKEIEGLTGIKEPNLSAIENDRIELTKKTAEIIGAALGVHPSSLLFPKGTSKKSKELQEIERKSKALREKKKRAAGF